MANNNNAYIKIRGTAGRDSHLVSPKLMKSGNYVFQIIVENPDFSGNDLSNPAIAKAVQDLQLRIKSSNEYPTPSIFLTLPQFNRGSDKPNIIHFWRADKKLEIQVNQNPAEGQPVEVGIDTYTTDNSNTSKYNGRVLRIRHVIFPDDNIKWYTPDPMAIDGFKSLEEQGIERNAPAAPAETQTTQNTTPLANNGGANANAFGNNAGAGAPNSGTAPTQSPQTPYTQNANGQNTTNTNPFANAGQTAPANPFANAGQSQAPTANPFGNQTQANAGQTAPANPFATPQNGTPNSQTAANQNQTPNPFANNTNVSDEDLPF